MNSGNGYSGLEIKAWKIYVMALFTLLGVIYSAALAIGYVMRHAHLAWR